MPHKSSCEFLLTSTLFLAGCTGAGGSCPAGSEPVAGLGCTSCQPCAAGSASPGGSAACSLCPGSTYATQGASACTPCATGSASFPGSTDASQCIPNACSAYLIPRSGLVGFNSDCSGTPVDGSIQAICAYPCDGDSRGKTPALTPAPLHPLPALPFR